MQGYYVRFVLIYTKYLYTQNMSMSNDIACITKQHKMCWTPTAVKLTQITWYVHLL